MNSIKSNCQVNPDIWLDYVEGEADPALREDLSLHIVSCTSCQGHLKEIQAIRTVLDSKADGLPGDDFFEQLEGKIMSKVSTTGLPQPPPHWRGSGRRAFYTMAVVFTFIASPLIYKYLKHSKPITQDEIVRTAISDELIVETSAEDLEFFGNVINGYEGSSEMVLDAAAHKMAGMDEVQARKSLGL